MRSMPIYLVSFCSISIFNLDFDLKYFWAWTDFQSYLDFMLAVWLVGAIITFFMLPYMWFNEIMGFLAVFIEAMLGKCTTTTIHIKMKHTHTKNRFSIKFISFIMLSVFHSLRCTAIFAKLQ